MHKKCEFEFWRLNWNTITYWIGFVLDNTPHIQSLVIHICPCVIFLYFRSFCQCIRTLFILGVQSVIQVLCSHVKPILIGRPSWSWDHRIKGKFIAGHITRTFSGFVVISYENVIETNKLCIVDRWGDQAGWYFRGRIYFGLHQIGMETFAFFNDTLL